MPRLWLAVLMLAAAALAPPVRAADHAVVFMYHRFGEDDVPSTNIRLAQFEAHLEELASGGFHVWSLSRIVAALRQGADLPDRTVAITADDAYRSVMTEAWPRLKARGWPMTLFVATDQVDRGGGNLLGWDEIRQLRDEGMEIGAHSAAHGHMAAMTPAEAEADFARANDRYRAMLGAAPDLLAYPYGEYSNALIEAARQAGYKAAFGQHSGPVGRSRPLFDLPRFAMNEHYGGAARFSLAARSLPLAVADPTPADTLLTAGIVPEFGFTLKSEIRPQAVTCFHSAAAHPRPLMIAGRHISFRAPAAVGPGRSRFNCTAPAGGGRYYWYGRQFVVAGGSD